MTSYLSRSRQSSPQLADFGFAAVLSQPTYKVAEPVGSPGYAAAEVLRVMPYDGQADVFSLGVISFVLLSGEIDFNYRHWVIPVEGTPCVNSFCIY